MSNCKSCSAPLPLNLNICEYCGVKAEENITSSTSSIGYAATEIVKVVPHVLRTDNYKTENNSIKPQFNQQDTEIHWTIILSFVLSIIVFIGSFSAERDKDWALGFLLLVFLSFAFNFSGVKNFSQKNWMVTTNYILLGLSILCSFIILF